MGVLRNFYIETAPFENASIWFGGTYLTIQLMSIGDAINCEGQGGCGYLVCDLL